MGRLQRYIAALTMTTALAACGDSLTKNKYSNRRAYYSCNHVISIPTLYHACTGQGMWCTITLNTGGTIIHFDSPTEHSQENITANTYYKKFYLGPSGLIVGLPNMAEMGADMPVVTCYDITCPTCSDLESNTRRLKLLLGGQAKCERCQRVYDLNNQGIVAQGEGGRPLDRYRVAYNGNNLVVSNP